MRLDEINNSNRLWGKLKGVDFNTIHEYNDIIKLLKLLIQLKSPHRVVTYAHTIQTFEDIILDFINANYAGYPNQNDITKFKTKCKKMLANIQYLKSHLP